MSLLDGVTPDYVANEIIMLRGTDERLVLLVEGPTDMGTLEYHTNLDECRLYPAGSKNTVLGALEIVHGFADRVGAVMGLVDADLGKREDLPASVTTTDCYDLEATALIRCGIALRIASAHLSGRATDVEPQQVVEMSARAAAAVGLLRAQGMNREGATGSFRGLPFHVFMDAQGSVQSEVLLQVLQGRGVSVSAQDVEDAVRDSLAIEDYCRVASGHDFAAALAAALSIWSRRRLNADSIEDQTRSALGCDDLARLRFAERLGMAASELGYRLWRCPCPAA